MVLEDGKNQTIVILSLLLIPFALTNIICGSIWSHTGGPDGHGLWCGVWLTLTAFTGISLRWYAKKSMICVFILMAFVALIICITQAAIAGAFYRKLRVLTEDPLVKCQTIQDVCFCNKTDSSDIDVPLRLPSCDPLKTLTSSILAITIASAFGMVFTLAETVLPCFIILYSASEKEYLKIQKPRT